MQLIHISKEKLKHIVDVEQIEESVKPRGIWYAPDDLWLIHDYANNEKYKYFYRVELHYTTVLLPNINKVLQIRNVNDFMKLTYKYGYTTDDNMILLDWAKIGSHYGGIEIIPIFKHLKKIDDAKLISKFKKHGFAISMNVITWLIVFYVPCGCVWNKSAIKSIKSINIKDIGSFGLASKDELIHSLKDQLDSNKKLYDCYTEKKELYEDVKKFLNENIELHKKVKMMEKTPQRNKKSIIRKRNK